MALTDIQISDMKDTLDIVASDVLRIRNDFAEIKVGLSAEAVSDLRTVAANIETRIAAVEERLTARETAHQALVSQLNDILGQMQTKLQGALELKPEIMPYDNALAAGYLDAETGIKLRADSTAQRKFTSQLLILRTYVEYGGAPVDMPVRLWDYHGVTHTMPFTAYVGLMLRFGQFVEQVEARF